VEKFIKANTQELAKDKWLCPLSGKKFKGPEFVQKHILAKHMEKVEEVKQEVKSLLFPVVHCIIMLASYFCSHFSSCFHCIMLKFLM